MRQPHPRSCCLCTVSLPPLTAASPGVAGKQLMRKFGELIPNLKSRKEPKPKPEGGMAGLPAMVPAGPSGAAQPAPTITKQTSSKKKNRR